MIRFSYWKFKKEYTLDEVIIKLNNKKTVTNSSNCIASISENSDIVKKETYISSKTIEYIFFKILISHPETEEIPEETKILIYNNSENKLKMIVFRGITNVQKHIDKYFKKNDWGAIVYDTPAITEDLLYWMFKFYMDTPSNPLSSLGNIYINLLTAYSGVTKDRNNTLSGNGDRICEILGTLAFLLSNDDLQMLRPQVHYKSEKENHNIIIEFKPKGTFSIDESSYNGDLLKKHTKEDLKHILVILCTNNIIPNIIYAYLEAKENEKWNISLKKDFIERMGSKIKARVDIELNKLGKEIAEEKSFEKKAKNIANNVKKIEEKAKDIVSQTESEGENKQITIFDDFIKLINELKAEPIENKVLITSENDIDGYFTDDDSDC
ncbi:hypothetical protein HGQ85_11565 [Clostridioides difficile]|nr:hypothetical protein [Clostridioides difficile]